MLLKELLRKIRQELWLTQAELAQRADLSITTISMVERGDRKPSAKTIRRTVDFANKECDMQIAYKDIKG